MLAFVFNSRDTEFCIAVQKEGNAFEKDNIQSVSRTFISICLILMFLYHFTA